jgi:hypothetical protein
MDDFERGLSTALKSTPPPPVEIDPARIVRGTARRHPVRNFVAPVLAAALVAAVTVAVVLAAHSGGSNSPTNVPGGPSGASHSAATGSPARVVVPLVVRLHLAEARHVLDQSHLRWTVTRVSTPESKGVVVAQGPRAGAHVVAGSTVYVRGSRGT